MKALPKLIRHESPAGPYWYHPDHPDCQDGNVLHEEPEQKILRLTLKRRWFDMVASNFKKEEYRHPGKWILSRLVNKDGTPKQYDAVEFRNGYAPTSPVVTCQYLGFEYGFGRKEWGGGATPGNPLIVIKLGDIL